jgi:uncharacterized protein
MMQTLALRLGPGEDLADALVGLVGARGLQAGLILTCVGSLRHATLRLANRDEGTRFGGPFEIVSLVGTLGPDGNHLHLALSDGDGRMVGGHLLSGCPIYTTAEIVIGELSEQLFTRPLDPATGYDELMVVPRPPEV